MSYLFPILQSEMAIARQLQPLYFPGYLLSVVCRLLDECAAEVLEAPLCAEYPSRVNLPSWLVLPVEAQT